MGLSGPFVCKNPDCNKSFLRKEHLNRHLLSHTSSRPHKCLICDRSFARSDILSRHMLQHKVIPSDETKRTPSACQTCRRRKTKCDSTHPCSACVDLGEPCVREPSSMQVLPSRASDSSYSGAVTEVESGTIVSNSIPGSANNSLSTMSMNLDPMQTLAKEVIEKSPGISLSPPSTDPSAYFEDASLLASPFDLPLPLPTESEDQIPSFISPELQMTDGTNFAPTQAQLIMAQIKSTGFHQFHQAWPLLHMPTFTAETTSPLLLSALSVYLMWRQNANGHQLLLDEISQQLTRALMVGTTRQVLTDEHGTDTPLQTLQALVIALIYAISASASTLTWAAQWIDIAVSTFRRLGILNDQWLPEDQGQLAEERWVQAEQMKRLVYAVLRIDAYLCIILDRPPTLRYQEIRLSLPVSDELWRAETREARTRLHWYEPAGRSRSAFSTMMRDGLETHGFMTGYLRMPRLSLEDNHFSLCSFMSEIWGICRETHEEHHLSYRSPELNRTADRVRTWKGYLQDWRAHIEQTDDLENALFSESAEDTSPFLSLNLTLYHLVSLKMYANLRLLEYRRCCINCHDADVENVLRTWTESADGREAVYHAVRLKRIYEHQTTFHKSSDHRLANVLGSAGLLASAIVLCLYSTKVPTVAARGRGTDSDEAIISGNGIELAQLKLVGTPDYETWISQGGLATVNGVPLHVFSVPRLSSWYHEQLASSLAYSSRLIDFLLTLKT